MPTLEELENEVWPAPEFDSFLVGRCHQLRRKPIEQFTIEDLRIMIGQDIGLQFLMPGAVAVLEDNPLAEGDFYAGDLLVSVTSVDSSFFEGSPELLARVVLVTERALGSLHASRDDSHLIEALRQFINRYAT